MGIPLLIAAVRRRDPQVIRYLVRNGAEIDESYDDLTALTFAAINNFTDEARVLLEDGAEVNSGSSLNTTPLHHAADKGNDDLVRLLLEFGAEVEIHGERGVTPLHWATQRQRWAQGGWWGVPPL